MSRHRDIRNMDFSDDYEGYNDVYGHSVDDDYYISPSNRQFIYNRENSRDSTRISGEQDIQEEEELEHDLTDVEKAQLESCIDQVKVTLESIDVPRNELVNLIISNKFNVEQTIGAILDNAKYRPAASKEKVSCPAETANSAITVVATPKTTINVTKGFELPSRDLNKASTTPRSHSPASGRATPITSENTSSATEDIKITQKICDNKDVERLYQQERGGGKDHLYMVVIGHVDAGKSTLMGHLLCELGQVNQKTMHKYEQESKKLGKQSFMYAWVLDETGEERNRGITMDIARFQFDTKHKVVTLLDAPGHKDFIPNMISGASQADVALLVVDATRGEFETGFDLGGQTREHALLVRSLGVTQLAVAVNKLDTVSWSQERFNEIVQKMQLFLKQVGFKEGDVTFVPCSGLTGQNLVKKPTENELLTWYSGPNLIDVIDNFKSPERPISKPFRLSVDDVFKGTGSGFCVSGRVETGAVNVGDKVLVCPNKENGTVKSLAIEDVAQNIVFAGDQAVVTLFGIEMQNLSVGNILCHPQYPVPISTKFQARIVIFNVSIPITNGFSVVLHHQSLVEPAVITKLISQINKSTGEIMKKRPRFLTKNSSAIVEITASKPIAVELYSECRELGRITLRMSGVTIAAGLITDIIN